MMRLELLLVVCLCGADGGAQGLAGTTARFGQHLDGKAVAGLGAKGTRAVVLFFVATDCPISDRSFPEMKRLSREFKAKAVEFWFVYPNATESRDAVGRHQREFDAEDEAILDPDDSLVRLTGAIVTPEAAVLVPAGEGQWKTVYRGRIDDRFVRIGLARPAPTQMLTERALRSVLAGLPVTQDTGTPVGCSILRRAAQR